MMGAKCQSLVEFQTPVCPDLLVSPVPVFLIEVI